MNDELKMYVTYNGWDDTTMVNGMNANLTVGAHLLFHDKGKQPTVTKFKSNKMIEPMNYMPEMPMPFDGFVSSVEVYNVVY